MKRFWSRIPPWFIVGAAAVLFPIFGYMTFENIHRQKQYGTRLLLEKGAALIRSFEAGTRSGIMGGQKGEFELQRLLKETAQQPDIRYLLVAGVDGSILAHSDTAFIGTKLDRGMDLAGISRQQTVLYRIANDAKGTKIFEVFRRFSPTGGLWAFGSAKAVFNQLFNNKVEPEEDFKPPPLIIFVGLDMTSVEEARESDMYHTIVMGVALLFIGFAGILMLFLAQNYQAARASLSKIKAFSDTLVENMPIGLLAIDNEKRIASLNNVAEDLLGASFERISKKHAMEVLPENLWKELERIENGAGFLEREIECPAAGCKEFMTLEVSAAPLKDEHGAILGYVLLFKDLTEVKSLRKEIARSQRLASVGRLAAGVAHEIRNPLSSIKGFATYFKERYKDVAEDRETAEILIQEVDRLNRVVGQLLELARPVAVVKSLVSADDLVRGSLQVILRQAEKCRISVESEIPDCFPDLFVDEDKIRQVLLNLYLNAIDSMKDGNGKRALSVSLHHVKAEKRIEIRIADSGTGICEGDLSHIFDPFFTTKSSGSGLGLAIVHNIMEAHQGEIKVQSSGGNGTTIMLKFPAEEAE